MSGIQRRVAVSLKNGIVVDADGHIMEPANLWQDYMSLNLESAVFNSRRVGSKQDYGFECVPNAEHAAEGMCHVFSACLCALPVEIAFNAENAEIRTKG